MNPFYEIFRRNRSTYYNYNSGNIVPVWPRVIFSIFVSSGVAILVGSPSPDLLSSLIALFSILTGFGFTAQFFLVDKKFEIVSDPSSIEQKNLQKKVDRLSEELFANNQYFNLVAIIVIIICVMNTLTYDSSLLLRMGISENSIDFYDKASGLVGLFFVFFVSLEAFSTFVRILVRTEYLFRKVQEAKPDP